jgi:hypothetical protein
MDWDEIVRLAQDAFRIAVNEWLGKARIQGGTVRGPKSPLALNVTISRPVSLAPPV